MAYFRKIGNKWSFTMDIGKDPVTGKRKQKTKSGFKTKKEAQQVAAQLERDISSNNHSISSFTYYDTYKLWIEQAKVKPTTMQQKELSLKKHIFPVIGNKKIKDISPLDVQQLINRLAKQGLKDTTIYGIKGYMDSIFNYAVALEIIHRNPSKNIKVDPGISKKTIWSPDEMFYFMENVRHHSKYWLAYYIALGAGPRLGEISSLKVYDLKENLLDIQRTIAFVEGKWIVQSPKTKSSERIIPLPEFVVQAYHEYLEEFPSDTWVFQGKKHGFITTNALRKDFNKMIKRLGVTKIKFHNMRASLVTALLNNKVPVHLVAKLVGHSNTNTTYNDYTVVNINDLQVIADSINTLFSGRNVVKTDDKPIENPVH